MRWAKYYQDREVKQVGDEITLHRIASHCTEYEPISTAQGYGISWLNTAMSSEYYRCDWCVYWRDGSCCIYVHRNRYH